LDFDFEKKEVTFKKIFDGAQYLFNPNYSIGPRFIKRIESIQNKEIIMLFVTSGDGSPPSKVGVLEEFLSEEIQQYFKVFEKKFNSEGKLELIDVTSDFFDLEESKTKSLNNAGSIHFIDVDQDGIIDLFPQLGQTPVKELGGINRYLKYPTWNGKHNTIYFFKGMPNGRYKLTDFMDFQGFYHPQNFNFDYSTFNDQGIFKDQRLENFTAFNLTSIHDLNNDGNLELLMSSQPDFLTLLTKNPIQYPSFATKSILSSSFQNNFSGDMISRYDFSLIDRPLDSLILNLDNSFSQIFELNNEELKITHYPEFFEMNPLDSLHTSVPPFVGNSKLIEKEEETVNLILDLSKFHNRDYFINNLFIETKYSIPYFLRMGDNVYVKDLKLIGTNKNLAPLPFNEISSKFLEDGNKRFEIEISNSVDLNKNNHLADGQNKAGLQYGYELYMMDSLVEEVIFSNINYSSYENNAKTKIFGLSIPIGELDFNKLSYKIFALDTENPDIKTYSPINDKTSPVIKINTNINVKLNQNGNASIDLLTIEDASFDNIGIVEKKFSKTSFTCADLGTSKVTFTAADASGNTSSAEVTVTVIDEIKPTLKAKAAYTVKLDTEGKATLRWEDIDEGSSDNCSIKDKLLSKASFTCADLGTSKINFTAKDASGNISSAEVTVTVVDEIKPLAKAKSTYIIKLDAEGKAALKWEELDEGSSDNCSIKDKLLSKTTFTCANLGPNKITFTAKDASGNTSSAEVTVTVVDEIKPILKAKVAYTIKLDAEGKATLKWEDLDEGSSDNCSIKDKLLSKTSFTCADLGTSKITFTAKDASGNISAAEVTITVVDDIKPVTKVKSGYTIKLDVAGKATLKWEDIDEGSSDNCSITERKLSKTEFSRTDGGDNKVTYTLTDISGNTSSIDLTVRVDIVLSAPERSNQGNSIKAYPNPVNDYLYMEFAEGISTSAIRGSSLVDASGKVLGELTLEEDGNGRLGFSTRDLKTGMYFLRLSTRDTLHLIKFTVIH
jgi:hypothetical protein